MPWCATWGMAASPSWWILPLIGFVFMTVMLLVCSRGFCGGFGCMGGCRRKPEQQQTRSGPVAGSRKPT